MKPECLEHQASAEVRGIDRPRFGQTSGQDAGWAAKVKVIRSPSPMAASCRFTPKKPSGPLSSWCVHCNVHKDNHSATSPRGADRPKGMYPSLPDATQSRGGGSIVAVFDFDQTLASIQVGIFDVNSSDRVFGGAARTQIIINMIAALRAAGAEVHIVTRNSVHVVRKALGPRPGINVLGLVGSILGREDYDWSTPKSAVIAATNCRAGNPLIRRTHSAAWSLIPYKCAPRSVRLARPRSECAVVLGTHCDPGLATHDRCHVVCCPLPVCSVAWRIPSAAVWPPRIAT